MDDGPFRGPRFSRDVIAAMYFRWLTVSETSRAFESNNVERLRKLTLFEIRREML